MLLTQDERDAIDSYWGDEEMYPSRHSRHGGPSEMYGGGSGSDEMQPSRRSRQSGPSEMYGDSSDFDEMYPSRRSRQGRSPGREGARSHDDLADNSMPSFLRDPTDSMASNPRQRRAGGRERSETGGHLVSDLPSLFERQLLMEKEMQYFSEQENQGLYNMVKASHTSITQEIREVQAQSRQGAGMPRGIGGPTRHQNLDGHTGDESDFQPRGSRHDDHKSLAGRGRYPDR